MGRGEVEKEEEEMDVGKGWRRKELLENREKAEKEK